MRVRPLLLALCALALPACDDEPESTRVEGDTLTIYSSLPLRGTSAEAARSVAAGQRLALEDAGRRVGSYRIRLVRLDSTTGDSAIWDPGQVNANAERAANDETAIAYLGELDYGGSAVSLPITNSEGLLQVAPLDGLTSLTRRPPGSPREGPERYYPSERRTFLRLVPNDLLVAEALVDLIRERGLTRVTVIYDESIYGRELAGQFGRRARTGGLTPSGTVEDRDEPGEVRSVVEHVASERPDAIVYSGTAGATFAALLAGLRAELPGVPIWGGSGLAAGVEPAGEPGRVAWLQAVRPPSEYPARGRVLLRRLGRSRADGLYGYESMRLVLDAIESGGADRRAVVRAALSGRLRRSVLGPYRIFPRGDVSERRLAIYGR